MLLSHKMTCSLFIWLMIFVPIRKAQVIQIIQHMCYEPLHYRFFKRKWRIPLMSCNWRLIINGISYIKWLLSNDSAVRLQKTIDSLRSSCTYIRHLTRPATVCSGADQRKHQSSASLDLVRGIHRWPANSQHKGPITRKMFPFDDAIMKLQWRNCTTKISTGHIIP